MRESPFFRLHHLPMCFVGGFILSYLIALACTEWSVRHSDRFRSLCITELATIPPSVAEFISQNDAVLQAIDYHGFGFHGIQFIARLDSPPSSTSVCNGFILRAGWPLKCAQGSEWNLKRRERHGLCTIPISLQTRNGQIRGEKLFPYYPMSIGLLANSGLYALWVHLCIGCGECYKRYRRRLRGRCEICGYDLQSLQRYCPECGAQHNRKLSV